MMSQPTPSFRVGSVPVYGDLILAPMDGVSDSPYRSICRELGSAMSYTEFINARDVLYGHPHLAVRLLFTPPERPVVYQIYDDQPDRLLKAALILRQYNPDIIDINMGCSVKTVTGRGAGASLLRSPEKIAQIFSSLTHSLDIPITGKIRLGWDENSRNYLEIAKIIEDNGGSLVAVHARTKTQTYLDHPDWDCIAEIKQALKIPVVGNGDIRTVADIEQMKQQTGCDAVMIGRAAVKNPWIFSRKDRPQVSPKEVHTWMLKLLDRLLPFYENHHGLFLFRKFAKNYLKPYDVPKEMLYSLLTCEDEKLLYSLLEDTFQLFVF